jgi:hypothetical protein
VKEAALEGSEEYRIAGTLGALWGLSGVLLLLGSAIVRLTPVAWNAFSVPFCWQHWTALGANILFMAYAEGYRAFQRGFSPRVAARARYLMTNPRAVLVVFAPLFCMGFFHATRRRQITSLSVTAGVILLVVIVRWLPQPWRGIIDAGVVVGLAWGLIALMFYGVQAFRNGSFPYSPEVPDEAQVQR